MEQPACCGVEFSSEEALVRHQVKVHGTQWPPAGSCCGLVFYTEEALKDHLRVHHGR